MNAVVALKFLFGLPDDMAGLRGFPEENINCIEEFSTLLSSRISDDDYQSPSDMHVTMCQVSESVKSLLLLFQNSTAAVKVDDTILHESVSFPLNNFQDPSRIHHFGPRLLQTALPSRRKLQPADSSNRRARGDNSVVEITNPTTFSRGLGLVFLLHQPELTATLIHALKGADAMNKEDCVPLRYASVLISKGFTCSPLEVGIIVETHLRVVNAIDRLLSSTPQSEEFLWVLWELCGSDCDARLYLALVSFQEVVSNSDLKLCIRIKESEPAIKNSGGSPLNLAILHSAAEIVEVIVTDSTATSLSSWIGHAMELHKALHSSSPGSNRKDGPTRLLEWIDGGLVYHKNGAIGLLRYAAVLASGGDAHLTSTNILVSDFTDVVDNVAGESSNASDINVMENLASIISLKSFDGDNLRDSAIAQLTTAFRILAFISENPTVATTLYDEGAIAVIYMVLVNCSFMLERSSNSYDYLVDEGTECNSTSDLLLELQS
ncbi:uncharacterized protein LOC111310578 [Durio zibethinus]|uniref:Uncharacterized protein LOC111310578 n=1 Tax=Durio zibethinus TaxID=66656 RepID=A0A6P6ALT7_DURZI|nr:uncharacterized protein LOC111310578 [Durio zibethinus]